MRAVKAEKNITGSMFNKCVLLEFSKIKAKIKKEYEISLSQLD
jgi:hypothetical protein